jgi:hypothetical protein
MLLDTKPLELITEDDLQSLIDNGVSEGRTIEYKSELPGEKSSDKREFLADVSSFANTGGGHLIYGMKTADGVPTEICGLQVPDPDGAVLRLDNLIRDGIRPLMRREVQPIIFKDTNKGVAIVIRVPRGYASPYQIVFEKDYRFYSRDSAGKHRLEVEQLRVAFELLSTTSEQIRNFRIDRLAKIVAGDTPVAMKDSPKVVMHIIPFGAFEPSARFDLSSLADASGIDRLPCPTFSSGYVYYRVNFDGLMRWEKGVGETVADSYVQLFRTGIIEVVDGKLIQKPWEGLPGKPWIPARDYEDALIRVLPFYLTVQRALGVTPPLYVMLSVLGVKGYHVTLREYSGQARSQPLHPIDRDDLLVPEVQLDNFECDPAEVLRPPFEAVWNAGGFVRALTYDASGARIKV